MRMALPGPPRLPAGRRVSWPSASPAVVVYSFTALVLGIYVSFVVVVNTFW